jgi:sulfide:quinone oxidoreductase
LGPLQKLKKLGSSSTIKTFASELREGATTRAITQLKPVEQTPLPTGVPKVGLMTEEMALSVAHNIALDLGVISGPQFRPTLQAICFADFGDTGALFLADPLLPDGDGHRHRNLIYHGIWIAWIKLIFEKYFLLKMRMGWTIPWFERWGFRMIGLPLIEPIPADAKPVLSPLIL